LSAISISCSAKKYIDNIGFSVESIPYKLAVNLQFCVVNMAIVCLVVVVTDFNFVRIVTTDSTLFIGCYTLICSRLFGWNSWSCFYGAQKGEDMEKSIKICQKIGTADKL